MFSFFLTIFDDSLQDHKVVGVESSANPALQNIAFFPINIDTMPVQNVVIGLYNQSSHIIKLVGQSHYYMAHK